MTLALRCLLVAALATLPLVLPQDGGSPPGAAAVPGQGVVAGSTVESALARATSAYLAAYAAGDFERLATLLAPAARFEDTVMELEGREQVVAGLRQAFAAMTIDDLALDRRLLSGAHHSLSSGTVRFSQTGASLGLPGRTLRFELPMAISLRFDDRGLVLRHIDFVDTDAYAQQLRAQAREPAGVR